MNDLVYALLFFLPAGVANASPVFANKIPLLNRWNTPLDFGLSWRGKRVFGDNKSLRGVVFGTLIGAITGGLIQSLHPDFVNEVLATSFVPALNLVILGGALGLGSLVGDAVESFFKRRTGIKPGHSWFPFDQIDYIIGGLIFVSPFVRLDVQLIGSVFLIYFGLHLVFSYIGYLLHLKDRPI